MRVGVPREVKDSEFRVAATPAGVRQLVRHGHDVVVEAGAGLGSSFADNAYRSAGATVVESADEVWSFGDLILKVKEPIEQEYPRARTGQVLFTFLHLAAEQVLAKVLLEREVTAIAYETVQLSDGTLPLLAPMSEIAGRLAPQVGAQHLLRAFGGRGVLLGGVPGVAPAKVAIIGAGVAGVHAATMAVGVHADVVLLDKDPGRLRAADRLFDGRLRTVASNDDEIERACIDADLVVGAVLVPGAKAPTLVPNDLVAKMKPGSVLVDVSIDQGGCFEDSRPTTHADPTYPVHDAIFYCVANMPGAVPRTSTLALTNATLPYVLAIADKGWESACAEDRALRQGLNTHAGGVVNSAVAEALGAVVASVA